MTALNNYGIKAGHGQTTLDRVKTVVGYDPVADRVPLGSVRRRTLDGRTHYSGRRTIIWHFDFLERTGVNALVALLSAATDSDGAVTIETPNHQDVFTQYNAYLVNPQPQEHWRRIPGAGGAVENVEIELVIVS